MNQIWTPFQTEYNSYFLHIAIRLLWQTLVPLAHSCLIADLSWIPRWDSFQKEIYWLPAETEIKPATSRYRQRRKRRSKILDTLAVFFNFLLKVFLFGGRHIIPCNMVLSPGPPLSWLSHPVHGSVVDVLDCDTLIKEFELQWRYYAYFPINTHGENICTIIPSSMD